MTRAGVNVKTKLDMVSKTKRRKLVHPMQPARRNAKRKITKIKTRKWNSFVLNNARRNVPLHLLLFLRVRHPRLWLRALYPPTVQLLLRANHRHPRRLLNRALHSHPPTPSHPRSIPGYPPFSPPSPSNPLPPSHRREPGLPPKKTKLLLV